MRTLGPISWRTALIKSVLSIATVLILATQLCYKFYLNANSTYWTFLIPSRSLVTHAVKPLALGDPMTIKHGRAFIIDKRYTAKPVFALPPVIFRFALHGLASPEHTGKPAPAAVFSLLRHRPLRGPPTTSVYSCLTPTV